MLSPSPLLSPGPRAELHVEVVPNKDIWNEKQCPPAVHQWSYGTTGGLRPRGFGMPAHQGSKEPAQMSAQPAFWAQLTRKCLTMSEPSI